MSDFTYEGLMSLFQGAGSGGALQPQAIGDYLLVTAVIDPATGAGTVRPVFLFPGIDAETPAPGEYQIVLFDGGGLPLAEYPVRGIWRPQCRRWHGGGD